MITFTGKRLRLCAAVLLSALASGAGIALMATSAWLLSRAAEHPPVLYLMVAIVSVRLFGLSRGVLRYLERLVGHDLGLELQGELRQVAYLRLTRSTWLGRGSGDLLSRMVLDVDAVQDLVVRVLIPFASAGLVVTATSVALVAISPVAGTLILGSALVAGAVLPWLAARGSRQADATLAPLRADLASLVASASSAATDLAAYGADDLVAGRLAAIDTRLRQAEGRAALVRGLTTAAHVIAAGFGLAAGLWVGGRAVADRSLAPVFLAVLVLTPVALHEVLVALPHAAQLWTRTRVALSRVREVLDAPPIGSGDAVARSETGRPELSLTGASIGWPGHDPILEQLDLSVRAGERVCLTGPSGSGKTSIAATLMGLIPLVAGQLTVAGRVGYLAQDAYIFDTTVAENVRIGKRDATDAEVRSVLSRVGLDLALNRVVGEHGTALSGGEARRLALARLLLENHPILILDEPTEHLDRGTAQALTDDLWEATRGSATLVISHDPEVAARCARVVALPTRRERLYARTSAV